jgi:YVTN family beta-propeller protein
LYVKSISRVLRFAAPVALAAGLVLSVGAPAWAAGSGYTYTLAATISPPSNTSAFYAAVDPVTQTAYVADGDNELLVISESTDTVTGTIAVNGGPETVAVNPSTDTIYVSTFDNGVAVIDGATDTVTTTIPLGPAVGMAVDPATNTVYAVGNGTGTIAVIDGSTNTVTDTLTGFDTPFGIAVDPGTGNLYIADRGTDVVTVINVSTDTVTGTIDTSVAPLEIAVNPVTQTVYVTVANGTMLVISESTNTVTTTLSVGVAPAAVAVDTSTNVVYVGDSNTDDVYVIDGSTDTQTATIGLNSAVADNPGGLVADSVSHTAFAVALVNNAVYVISQGTTQTSTTVTTPSSAAAGSTVTLTADISPAPDAGTVGFTLNGTAISACAAQPVDPSTGQATCTTSAPTTTGAYTVAASYKGADGYDSSSNTGTLNVVAGPAATVAIDTGNNQSATAGQQFATPLSVTVTDAYGNTVDDATVTFSIAAGTGGTANFGGTAQTATATTDSSGVATAPALYAGTAAGPVMVTATSGTGQTTFVETVTSAGPARADLAIRMSAPATLTHGASGTITVTVTNNGPQAAAHVLTALYVPNDLTITNRGGGTVLGSVDFFTAPTLASGQKLTYTVTVKAGATNKTVSLLAVTGSATRDPNLLNNITTASLKIT